jgi:hypothetical protein
VNRAHLLAVVLAAPLLMAPDQPTCHVCTIVSHWDGSVAANQVAAHFDGIHESVEYRVELLPSKAATLDVSGPISGLSCESSGLDRICSFVATADGTLKLEVTGGSQGADYDLFLLLPE